jgi:hypothetical protein
MSRELARVLLLPLRLWLRREAANDRRPGSAATDRGLYTPCVLLWQGSKQEAIFSLGIAIL